MSCAGLHLLQLVSPALPVGAFSYSEGLEVLVQNGRIKAVSDLQTWLEAELHRGAIGIEAAALRPLQEALRMEMYLEGCPAVEGKGRDATGRTLLGLNGWLLAQREAPELRAQQRQMGQSLLELLADLGWPLPGAASGGGTTLLSWPAAWAWAGLCLAVPLPELVEAYLYGWTANQISAAVRLVPLGPTQGQRLQLALAPLLAARAQELADADPEDLWTGGVGSGLTQLQHVELYSRLFRS
jgi:urease accessory protein